MIGIFDSGIGGVTVFREILKELPNYEYFYYSDSLNNPYGEKSTSQIQDISRHTVQYLIQKKAKIIVIACNTASLTSVEVLRKEFNVPIIAIEPAYKMVYDNNFDGKTLILATPRTIKSPGFAQLYQKYNNHKTTIIECPHLADLIEQDKKEEIKEYLNNKLSPYKDVANVVLGCTHYPLVKEEIKNILGNVNFYEGSVGLTKQLQRIIKQLNLKETKTSITFYDSSNNILKEKRFWKLLNMDN